MEFVIAGLQLLDYLFRLRGDQLGVGRGIEARLDPRVDDRAGAVFADQVPG
jgi:hypothetical protein